MAKFTLRNVQADKLLQVLFRDIVLALFTITVEAGAGGTVSPTGPVSVEAGQDVTFDITPDAGKEIDKILVDGVEQSPDAE